MTVRTNSYELPKLRDGYDKLVTALECDAMLVAKGQEGNSRNAMQFYMPGGKVVLALRRSDGRTFLDVSRTSWFEPKYVRHIVEKFGGEWSGSSRRTGDPTGTIDLFFREA